MCIVVINKHRQDVKNDSLDFLSAKYFVKIRVFHILSIKSIK